MTTTKKTTTVKPVIPEPLSEAEAVAPPLKDVSGEALVRRIERLERTVGIKHVPEEKEAGE